MDVITYLCFSEDINAANERDFQSPLITGMSDGAPIIIYLKHFSLFRKLISIIPPEQVIKSNPQIAGMIRMQQVSGPQSMTCSVLRTTAPEKTN